MYFWCCLLLSDGFLVSGKPRRKLWTFRGTGLVPSCDFMCSIHDKVQTVYPNLKNNTMMDKMRCDVRGVVCLMGTIENKVQYYSYIPETPWMGDTVCFSHSNAPWHLHLLAYFSAHLILHPLNNTVMNRLIFSLPWSPAISSVNMNCAASLANSSVLTSDKSIPPSANQHYLFKYLVSAEPKMGFTFLHP